MRRTVDETHEDAPRWDAAGVLGSGVGGALRGFEWLTYAEAARYCGWTVAYLRNLVSAGQVPVYGRPRMRRFRRDVLDQYLTNPDAAMRRFRSERNQHGS